MFNMLYFYSIFLFIGELYVKKENNTRSRVIFEILLLNVVSNVIKSDYKTVVKHLSKTAYRKY